MKLLNERNQAREVVLRWEQQYPANVYGKDKKRTEILPKLKALDLETCTAAEVKAIIGNDSWVCPQTCDECGSDTWNAVQLGQPPDYDSATAMICYDCLLAAIRLTD